MFILVILTPFMSPSLRSKFCGGAARWNSDRVRSLRLLLAGGLVAASCAFPGCTW